MSLAANIQFFLALAVCCFAASNLSSRQALHYPEESRLVALQYSGELWPSDSLVAVCDSELTLLRNTWQDSLPAVKVRFYVPWESADLYITCDPRRGEELIAGEDTMFQQMVSEFELDVFTPKIYARRIRLRPGKSVNLYRLAEKLTTVRQLQSVIVNPTVVPTAATYARVADGRNVNYFFSKVACPDVDFSYYHFVIRHDSAIYVGSHWECPPNTDSLVGHVSMQWLADWADSVETHRPAWVDTARKAIDSVKSRKEYRWTAPKNQ